MNSPSSKPTQFDQFFSRIYGQRWPQIFQALTQPELQIERFNLFSSENAVSEFKQHSFLNLPYCQKREKSDPLLRAESGLFLNYVMDPASLIVARQLKPTAEMTVLDMCAAPGGKSLVLAESMAAQATTVSGTLTLNEPSLNRRDRLTQVIQNYIPRDRRDFLFVKGLDGNQYGLRQPETFDRILADVPCSGERHLLEDATEFNLWTENRSKNLAVRQYSLLSSAWLALKPGGIMVYSTCSISPYENDEVLKKLVKKRQPQFLNVDDLNPDWCIEKTEWGYQILPDKIGMGPMFFSLIQKT